MSAYYLTRIQWFWEQKKSQREIRKINKCTHITLRTSHASVFRKLAALSTDICHFLSNFKQGFSGYLRHFLSVADQDAVKAQQNDYSLTSEECSTELDLKSLNTYSQCSQNNNGLHGRSTYQKVLTTWRSLARHGHWEDHSSSSQHPAFLWYGGPVVLSVNKYTLSVTVENILVTIVQIQFSVSSKAC